MGVQSAVEVTLNYLAESTFGVPAGPGGSKTLRRVSSSLAANRDTYASNEARADLQVSDLRHGMNSARGTIDGELSTQTYDDLIEAALRGAWTTIAAITPTQFATGITIANGGEANTSTITFAGAGNLFTLGMRVGMIVRLTGHNTSANNNVNLRITTLTSTVMTVTPRITAAAQQAAGWSASAPGRTLLMGTTKRAFTFEQWLPDAATYELFTGCRINGFNLNVPPNGMATIGFDVLGINGAVAAAAYFTSPTAAPNTGIVSGVDGTIRVAGAEQAVITGLQLNLTNNMTMQPVIGSRITPEVFHGRMVLTGSVSAFLSDASLVNAFLNETEVDIAATLQSGAVANVKPFIGVSMQRVKFTGAQKTVGPDGGVIVQFPFQALLNTASNGFDATTLSLHRSNA